MTAVGASGWRATAGGCSNTWPLALKELPAADETPEMRDRQLAPIDAAARPTERTPHTHTHTHSLNLAQQRQPTLKASRHIA